MLAVALASFAHALAFLPLRVCLAVALSVTFGRRVHVGDGAFAAFPGEVGIYGFPLPILKTVIRHCYKGN